ncbi:MAG: Lpg1974 family pore-forming outer membrane protein [Fuerstiella sp.]
MNIRNLLVLSIAVTTHVTHADDPSIITRSYGELPFLEVDANAARSAASLFRRPPAMPSDPSAPIFNLISSQPVPAASDSIIVQTQYSALPAPAPPPEPVISTVLEPEFDIHPDPVSPEYSFSSATPFQNDCRTSCHDSGQCGESSECECRDAPLFSGGVEIPFLRARISGAAPVFNVSPGAQRLVDPNYDPTIRYVAELRPEKSFGIRGRYFKFDHTTGFDPPFQPAALDIALDTADFEFVFHHDASRWNFDFSAGVEYSRLQYAADVATAVIGAGSATFEGVGPVFGINAEHQLGQTTISFFGSARAAFLMGTIKNEALLINMPRAEIKDEMAQVYQNQLGIIWEPDLFDRVGIAVKGAWETQFWLNQTFSDDSFGLGSNLSLTGPVVSAELSF